MDIEKLKVRPFSSKSAIKEIYFPIFGTDLPGNSQFDKGKDTGDTVNIQ
ncbi:hypothetical protein [Sphingobacterium lactis]